MVVFKLAALIVCTRACTLSGLLRAASRSEPAVADSSASDSCVNAVVVTVGACTTADGISGEPPRTGVGRLRKAGFDACGWAGLKPTACGGIIWKGMPICGMNPIGYADVM